ncbi:MAG: AraC family transcriptional regulator [Bacteroidota bacterium]
MTFVKPMLEQVSPTFGSSFSVKHYPEPRPHKPPKWHVHPEIELVYVRGGHGRRRIGTHVSYFTEGDLVLIGSNLPHWGFTEPETHNQSETVIHLHPDFLGTTFMGLVEMKDIRRLLDLARSGLSFHGQTKEIQGARLESLAQLDPMPRLLALLEVLQALALSEEVASLNVAGFLQKVDVNEIDRFRDVQQFVADHFHREIPLIEIAEVATMTVPAFCRYFKRTSGKTFVRYLNEYRIAHACKLLAEAHGTIAEVAYDCGFNSLSQFNRCFKTITERTPTQYRAQLSKVV